MKIKEKITQSLGKKILSWEENSNRRAYFLINKNDIFEVVRFLFKDMHMRFSIASGVDTPQGLEILYHFSYDLMPAAEWIEREIWEMLGIEFVGHPNLKHLLLDDDWPENNYPLRKEEG